MEQWPPQTNSRPLWKIGSDPRALLSKTYSAEFLALTRGNFHPQVAQRAQRLRHHPFSARLFDGRRRTIRHDCLQPFLARGNSHREPRWAPTDDEYICDFSRGNH
jgi:hypothetical protein